MEEKEKISLEMGLYLIALIKAAINEEEPPKKPDSISYNELFLVAKQQNIQTIIFYCLKSINNFENESIYIEWNENVTRSKLYLLTLESERKKIASKLEESKIAYLNLKGYVLKEYYPNKFMRQMGDYDILYDQTCRDRLIEIMEQFGYVAEDLKGKDDDFTKKPYYRFEFHKYLFEEFNEFNKYFNRAWERARKDRMESYEYRFTKEDFYIYYMAHFYKHYTNCGCGIRQLIDMYVYLRRERYSMDWKYINGELEKLRLTEFDKEMRQLCNVLFEDKPLSKEQERQFKELLCAGTYGNAEIFFRNQLRLLKKENKGLGYVKRKYIMKRLFPSLEFMKQDYPWLKQAPILLPLSYILRWGISILRLKKVLVEMGKLHDMKEID